MTKNDNSIKRLLAVAIAVILLCLGADGFTPPGHSNSEAGVEGYTSTGYNNNNNEAGALLAAPSIVAEKFIDGSLDNIDRSKNIDICIRIINCDQSNKLDDVEVREYIPNGFKLIAASHPYSDIKNPHGISWHPGEDIDFISNYNYTLRANKSGSYVIPDTIIKATIVDKYGNKNNILKNLGDSFLIKINDRPPVVKIDPEPPYQPWKIWSLLGHNATNFSAEIIDPDNDSIGCELISDSLKDNINKNFERHNGNSSKYGWRVVINGDPSVFTLKIDGKLEPIEKEIPVTPYIVPYSLEIATLLSGIIIGAATMWEPIRQKIKKLFKRKKKEKEIDFYILDHLA